MSGRLVGILLLLCGAIAGGALYYLQIYAFYEPVPDDGAAVHLTLDSGERVALNYDGFSAIDASSSPIRYRACFSVGSVSAEGVTPYPTAIPRNAPRWFNCFDAEAIAAEIKTGTAQVYLSEKNVAFGVDRVIALTADGLGYAWHELNACGEKAYDGTVVGEACPSRDTE